MTRRRYLLASAALALALGAVIALSRDHGDWPGGPRVTAARLRRSLGQSGLTIQWRGGRPGDGVSGVVAGVASRLGRGKVGFEFAIASGQHADDGMLGRAGFPTDYKIPDNPCPRSPCRFVAPRWRPDERGVLGNVAYAVYHLENEEDRATVNVLDDALFATFRRDDPRAYPVLDRP